MEFSLSEYPHRRFNPLTGDWVLVSPHRTERPWQGQIEKPVLEHLPEYDPDHCRRLAADRPVLPRRRRAPDAARLAARPGVDLRTAGPAGTAQLHGFTGTPGGFEPPTPRVEAWPKKKK